MTSQFVLIVSTGRTGTTYLEKVLTAAGLAVRQEPPPSRSIYMLSNLAASGTPVLARAAEKIGVARYEHSRGRWFGRAQDGTQVEINPFLSNFMPQILQSKVPPDAVVHVVREPVGWVRSMIQFGAYSWRKPLVPWLPFVYFRPRGQHLGRLGFPRRLAHEWVYRNLRICACERRSRKYVRIRYEDLFVGGMLQIGVLERCFRDVGVELKLAGTVTPPPEPANASRPDRDGYTISDEELKDIRELTSDLARRFGYG